MVMQMSMFSSEEKKGRRELKHVYKQFIEQGWSEELESEALRCAQVYAARPVLSEELSKAGSKATDIALNNLSKQEAKKILETLS